MVLEENPLLVTTAYEAIYDRFAPDQKRWIVFLVSFVGLLPMVVQGTFVPSIPQIAEDLDLTHAVVRHVFLTFSISIFASAIGALFWAAYSSFYGRRSIYLWGMPILCVGSCGVALSTSFQSLLFWRFVQTFGCAGPLSLGAGVIGDIYKLGERGTFIGLFFGVTLIGFGAAPFIGGAATQYWSWRNLHYSIGAWGFLDMLLIYFSLPETSHPGTLGIDKLPLRTRRWINIPWINPLNSLWLLCSPNLFAVTVIKMYQLFGCSHSGQNISFYESVNRLLGFLSTLLQTGRAGLSIYLPKSKLPVCYSTSDCLSDDTGDAKLLRGAGVTFVIAQGCGSSVLNEGKLVSGWPGGCMQH
ncbi:MFS general substrate transporter [Suillus brevipes Sb2]|nr:MFS general substrate transporter [Suillus brevipes Sb2]